MQHEKPIGYPQQAVHPQTNDLEHLRLLSIFHYVMAAVQAVFSLFPVFHLVIGIAMVAGAFSDGHDPPPEWAGWILIVIAASLISVGLILALLVAIAGRRIAQHRSHTFCFIMAIVQCVFVPLGMILGIFTLVVLLRPSVKNLFQGRTYQQAAPFKTY